jgi:hypothetical protein
MPVKIIFVTLMGFKVERMKIKAAFIVLVLSFLATVSAHAQSGITILPCGGQDEDSTSCPLDTWVIVLVAAFAVFAVFTLLKRKRSAQNSSLRSK